jgi:hypothetical protein
MARAPFAGVLVLCGVLSVLSGPAFAAQTASSTAPATPPTTSPPENQLFFRSTNVIRYNPLGLITDNQLSFRHLLYRADDNVLLRDNFVGVGFTPQVSAAFARVGALVEVQPLSILRLWANFDVVGYFGTFGLLQSFDSPNADFSDSTINARGQLPDGDPQKNFATWGSQFTLGMDLQVKVGPIAARNLSRLVRGSYEIRDGDTVYYDQFYDVLAPNNGLYLNNDTDLLYVSDFGLVAGVRMNVTQPFYRTEDFTLPEQTALLGRVDHQNGPTLRAGPLVTYTFFDDPTALFNKPTIIVVGNWWVAHRYRTGADVSQALPYLAVGFQVTSDLLPHLLSKKNAAPSSDADAAPEEAPQEEAAADGPSDSAADPTTTTPEAETAPAPPEDALESEAPATPPPEAPATSATEAPATPAAEPDGETAA